MRRVRLGWRPARCIQSGPLATSAFVHGILIVAVLMATRGTGTDAHRSSPTAHDPAPVIHVRYVTSMLDPFALGRAGPTQGRTARSERRSSVTEPQQAKPRLAVLKASLADLTDRLAEIRPKFEVADVMRGLDTVETKWATASDSEFHGVTQRLSDAVQPLVPTVKDGIYTPDLVDEQVAPRPGNPKPRYPESLLAAGIEADVNVMFVVDTTGMVDEPSIKFATHVHELFMDAIRTSLRKARFFPARFAGSLVPQLVRQEFRFEIRNR